MTPARSRRVLWLLAVATVVPMGVLAWLGASLLARERATEQLRARERLEVSAGRVALEIEHRLQEIEEQLSNGRGVLLDARGLSSAASVPILFQPAHLRKVQAPPSAFTEGELAEARSDLKRAEAAYRGLARSADGATRGGALLRLGRVLRKAGDREGALRAYAELEALGGLILPAVDQPAALVAKLARFRVLEEVRATDALRDEAVALGRLLAAGGWAIDRAAFEEYRDLVARWGGPAPGAAALARTEAAIRLWRDWYAGDLPARGRRVQREQQSVVLTIWTGGPDQPVAWFATSSDMDAIAAEIAEVHAVHVSGEDSNGQRVFGDMTGSGLSLTPANTKLPFILQVTPRQTAGQSSERASPASVLVTILSAAFLLMLAASYGLYRATRRELSLARQQTDFVATVSHEFRTPLTSLRHLTELLARDAIEEDRRPHYYALLVQETERLHRMVEGLLSFGRIEAGGYAWRPEPVAVSTLLSAVRDEFRRDPTAAGREVLLEIEHDLPLLHADVEALRRAVWNLLENAAKYSGRQTPIRIIARRSAAMLEIAVADRGPGIPRDEQRSIFGRFVRGFDATRSAVAGVGIGLALVARIAEAHGGRVSVASQPGEGSIFTVTLPIADARQSGDRDAPATTTEAVEAGGARGELMGRRG